MAVDIVMSIIVDAAAGAFAGPTPVISELGIGTSAEVDILVIEAPSGLNMEVVLLPLSGGRGDTVGVGTQVNKVSLEKVIYCSQSVTVTGGMPTGEMIVEQIAVIVGVYSV